MANDIIGLGKQNNEELELLVLIKQIKLRLDNIENQFTSPESLLNVKFSSFDMQMKETQESVSSLKRKFKTIKSTSNSSFEHQREFRGGVGVHSVMGSTPGLPRYTR